MPKVPLRFGEWRPDVALFDNEFIGIAENVYAGLNSYEPFAGLAPVTTQSLLTGGGNDSYTKVLLHFNGADASTTITDSNSGGAAHTWTANGNAQIDTAQSKFGGASGLFDGTGDYVTTPDHADFTLGTSDFTIDFWFKCNAAGGAALFIAGQSDAAATATTISFNIRRTGDVIQASVFAAAVEFAIAGTTQFTNAVNIGWHHCAFVRTGNVLKLFIDGVQEGGDLAFSGSVNNSANALSVGRLGELAGSEWNGWIDEFRLSIGIARWSANFTVPVGPAFIGAVCVGLTTARTGTGAFVVYAGTTTGLFKWSGVGWIDVSRLTGGAYAVAAGDRWSFAQFGTKLVAVHIGDVAQVVDVDAGGNFAALAGSPPQATSVAVVGDFLVLSGLSSNRRKIQWSAINDITGWIVGTNLSDEQEFPDGGPVQGVAGGETGFVIQDRSIRTMQFLPGDTSTIFSFSHIEGERGCMAKYGFVHTRGVLFLLAEDGFYAFGSPNPAIGNDAVNHWFINNCDPARRHQTIAFADPNHTRVLWAYYGSATSTYFDRLIIYDWNLNRWTYATPMAQAWSTEASSGVDLDTDLPVSGDELLDSTQPSLDSYLYTGGRPILAGITADGRLAFLSGNNLAAIIETAERHLTPGLRTFISAAYPIIDASPVMVSVSERERLQDTPSWGVPVGVEITGSAALFSSSRLHRFRVMVPADAIWTHAQGVLADAEQDGSTA